MVNAEPNSFDRGNRYGEFFHPLPLVALVILVVNDHWLKGASVLPTELTGKLSDFAGLLYFPLFLTAALRWASNMIGTLLPGLRRRLERRLRLTPSKLLLSCLLTGAGFTALKLCRDFAALYIDALASIGQRATVTPDPTDLFALPSLLLAYWIGYGAYSRMDRSTTDFLHLPN
jgi:hypothetical protein